ncbi:hypothetical protein BN946_scf184767.g7 [Trametes cinnabarina]|uniref:BRCT domain-containing protein n=1 Tax=Pycnoporus cinnabarinus TaxID=5643 RepID=A0A060SLJ3_PYCCI|nr:hypothetical protein BN946_scf184767.g7 [Trametes cinnabarina]
MPAPTVGGFLGASSGGIGGVCSALHEIAPFADGDKVTIDLYKQHALPFLSVYYHTRTHEFWCESFDKYFPPYGKPVDKAQNYPACRYYQTWLRMQKWTTRSRFESIRVKLRPLFMKLLWLPYNELDRIWNTRKPLQTVHARSHLSSRSWGSLGSGVRILVNEGPLLRSRQKMYLGNWEPPTREAKDSDEKDAVELEKEPVKDDEVRPLTRVASRFECVSVRTSPEGPTARHTNGARVDGPRNREPAAEASVGHDQPRTKRPSEFLSQEGPATKRRRLDESGDPAWRAGPSHRVPLLLPPGVTTGSIVNISVQRNVSEEKKREADFWNLQSDILEEFGTRTSELPQLQLRNVTQTSVTLEWPRLELATAKLRSLELYRDRQRVAAIPSPLTNTSTKVSGLQLDTEYTFQLVLHTTAGMFPSNVLKVRTHTMSDTSGVSVCFGTVENEVLLENAKMALREMGAKWSDKIQIDTTHFVCTTPAATPGAAQATGGVITGPGVEYQKALQLSIPVVQPQWILACHAEKKMMPIRPFYLGENPASPSHFRLQSMSQANFQSPSQCSATASLTQQNHAANQQSMPPQCVTTTSPPATEPRSAGRASAHKIPEEREPALDEGSDNDDDDEEQPVGHRCKGTMGKNFRFPSPTQTQQPEPPVPPVPQNSTVSPPLAKSETASPEPPLPEPPKDGVAEEAEKAKAASAEDAVLTTVGMVAPSSVEVPPPPLVDKERSLATDLTEDDLGETEEISLNWSPFLTILSSPLGAIDAELVALALQAPLGIPTERAQPPARGCVLPKLPLGRRADVKVGHAVMPVAPVELVARPRVVEGHLHADPGPDLADVVRRPPALTCSPYEDDFEKFLDRLTIDTMPREAFSRLKYISTVIVYAPRTSPLAEVFLPNIFRSAMAHHSLQLGSLPSYDQNDYAYGYYWLPDRQVVDRKKNIRQWREYIEEHFCNDPSFVEDAFLLSSFNEFKTIEQKPDSLVIILSKYHATALVINHLY